MANLKLFHGYDLQGNALKNVAAPVDGTDVATKNSAQAQADAAESAAIAAAALDATSKASAAQSNANSYTDTAISNSIDSAPSALNTLNELAAALGDDENFASTVTTAIGTKLGSYSTSITGSGTSGADGYEYTVTHNLNKSNVWVQAFDGNDIVSVFVRKVNSNSFKVITGAALGATSLTIQVAG